MVAGHSANCQLIRDDLSYVIPRWRIEFFNVWLSEKAMLGEMCDHHPVLFDDWYMYLFRGKFLKIGDMIKTFEEELEFWQALDNSVDCGIALEKEKETRSYYGDESRYTTLHKQNKSPKHRPQPSTPPKDGCAVSSHGQE